jgi:tetrahydromethanopterin S-methyltransferase subunit H
MKEIRDDMIELVKKIDVENLISSTEEYVDATKLKRLNEIKSNALGNMRDMLIKYITMMNDIIEIHKEIKDKGL